METALQQAKQQISQMGRNLYERALDLPFRAAAAKDKFKRAIQPNMPFSWDAGALEAPRMSRNIKPQNTLPFRMGQSRVAGESAQMRPYVMRPESDLTKQQIRGYLAPYNMRPAALEHYSNIPVKTGSGYVSPGSAGSAYSNPNFVGIAPNAPNQALLHEFMHQTPRFLDPQSTLSRIFTKMFYPELTQAEPAFRQRWGEGYMARPGAMQEEQFAEGLYPEAYYRHIFEPGGGD